MESFAHSFKHLFQTNFTAMKISGRGPLNIMFKERKKHQDCVKMKGHNTFGNQELNAKHFWSRPTTFKINLY